MMLTNTVRTKNYDGIDYSHLFIYRNIFGALESHLLSAFVIIAINVKGKKKKM